MKRLLFLLLLNTLFFTFTLSASFFGSSNNPTITINSTSSIIEGDSGTKEITLNISASDCPNKKDIIVDWSTASDTAIEDDDFVKTHGQITFSKPFFSCSSSNKNKTITIDINGDTNSENNETFLVNIQISANEAQDYTEGTLVSTITILNDDSTPNNTPPVIDQIPDQSAINGTAFNLDISNYTNNTDGDNIELYNLMGTLPNGLNFNSTTGIIDGIPDVNGTSTLSVKAKDSDGFSNTVTFNIVVSDEATTSLPINNADDLCYDTPTTNGFCMGMVNFMCTINTPIKNRSDDSLSDVLVVLASTNMFSAFSDCGVDGNSGDCNDSSQMSMMGMSALNNGIAYDMPNYDANSTHTTYTSAMFSFMNSAYEWVATYTKDSQIYQGVISACGIPQIEDPIFETCGMFPSALNTWSKIQSANNNIVMDDKYIYANNGIIDSNNNNSSIECNFNSNSFDCNVSTLDITPPSLPNFINSDINTTYTASGTETEMDSQYGDVTIASYSDITFSSDTTYIDNTRKIMLIKSLNIHKHSTVTFDAGDYYIGEWISASKLTVRTIGSVRLFINGNMVLNNDELNFNYNNNNGIPSDMFIFINENFTMTSSGGGNGYNMTAFVYTKGTFNAGSNTNNSNFKGAITAVGTITLNNNQTYTYDDTGLNNNGFGNCNSGGHIPTVGRLDAWETSISNRQITTKIVNKPFSLTLVSLNDDKNETQDRAGITVKYQLYDYDNNQSVTNLNIWRITGDNPTISKDFHILKAYRNLRIKFKFCQNSSTREIVNYAKCANDGFSFIQEISSTDNFAIRPEKFLISTIDNNLTSAKDKNFTTSAEKFIGGSANGYTISNSDYSLDITETKYLPNNTIDNSLNGDITITSYRFIDGNSSYLTINYNDIGKINFQLKDKTWADVDTNDTIGDCSDTGRYICGDTNATFIPSYFILKNIHLFNDNNSTFTYISNDLNISASIGLTITAKNDVNNTTQNFDSNSWENNVTISFIVNTPDTPNIIKNEINNTKIGFSHGVKQISFTENNLSKNLIFNFQREINGSINPFIIDGSDIELNTSSIYNSKIITIKNTTISDKNATFLYGRTHLARQRYKNNTGEASIYFESYCYGNDCNKTLLPNGISSKRTDDIRWFINEEHNSSTDGVIGKILHHMGTGSPSDIVKATTPTTTNPAQSTITYDGSYGHPYKTTMENNASSWLIHNEFDSTADRNEFSVEFEGKAVGWSGKHETNTTVKDDKVPVRTNRRSMW